VPADVAVHRQKLGEAIRLLHDGRRAPAERALRALVGSLARRADWQHAARGQVALAGSLLRRGRPREACEVLEDARTYAVRGRDDEQLVQISITSGHARLDEGRLDEAEVALHAAFGAARATSESTLVAEAAASLARCLFWRGRYAEALETIDRVHTAEWQSLLAVSRSRIAIGCGDISQAMAHATGALNGIGQPASPRQAAVAWYAMAFAHLAAGDVRAVHDDAERCLAASRAAHDPLRAFKVRLIAAEAERRCGSTVAARQLTARARALPLPFTVRARVSVLADLAGGAGAEAVRKSVAATGLEALALFAPTPAQDRLAGAFDTALDVLQLCQTGGGDAEMLVEICRRIRVRLQAAGVAFFVVDGTTLNSIAADGGRVEPGLAARVVDVRQPIPPSQCHERIEGGVPVKFGGETLGALTARWTMAAAPDAARAQMMLTMAATAAGAAVAALVARRRAAAAAGAGEILGVSAAIADVRAAVDRAAAAPFGVLIDGESGSGKELVARAVHRRGSRRDRAFCTLNCAALPDDLLDAELFGHARGAFTGALSERAGVFEDAHLGTLFLDEIGELSARAQAKLLRTLQEGEVRRVGENAARRVDVRLVAATNRDLRQEVAANRFRLDLLYRLDVIRVTVPPLRERREDIALLADHYWRIAADRVGSRALLAPATVAALTAYDWPGNVRELQNVLAALAVRSPKRGVVPPTALPPPFCATKADQSWRLCDARRTFEERFIRAALARSGGHRSRAASELGVSRQGLAKLMQRLGIE
jgi:transcriptional regulator with GAF, ATPase, and Fis domain/tetratricopeptide (TPR) repeat protein